MLGSSKLFDSFYNEQIRPNTTDLTSHPVDHLAELLQIRFTRGIVDRGPTLCHASGHDDVGCTGDRCLVEQHVRTDQTVACGSVEKAAFRIVRERGP